MHRNQFRLGRLGALWVFVVASAFAWAPSASAASQPSQAVGVIPGPIVTTDSHAPCGKFIAPDYGINEPGESLPGLEINWFERVPGDCTSTGYTWAGVGLFNRSTLAIDGVTPAALAGFDTLVLYGARWSSFDAASKAAINDFARTHKVVIWDSDSTVEKPGPDHVLHGQDYSTYLVPFVTFASGGQKASSETPAIVVGGDLLNSPTAINDAWLANEPHAIGDMTVMRGVDPSAWTVSIYAHNATLAAAPGGAPSDIVLAWARGDQATGTGLTIYSGIDADALDLTATQLGPIPRNEALASFQNQLAAAWCTAAPCSHAGSEPHHLDLLERRRHGLGEPAGLGLRPALLRPWDERDAGRGAERQRRVLELGRGLCRARLEPRLHGRPDRRRLGERELRRPDAGAAPHHRDQVRRRAGNGDQQPARRRLRRGLRRQLLHRPGREPHGDARAGLGVPGLVRRVRGQRRLLAHERRRPRGDGGLQHPAAALHGHRPHRLVPRRDRAARHHQRARRDRRAGARTPRASRSAWPRRRRRRSA